MKKFLNKVRPNTLQNRLILIITLLLLSLLTVSGTIYIKMTTNILENQVAKKAMTLSKAIAESQRIKELILNGDPNHELQNIAESIRKRIGAKFIVIGDKKGKRLAHPNPNKIGKYMVDDEGDDNSPVLVKGISYTGKAKGSLGWTIRGKSPVFDNKGKIIGIVSVGFLVDNVKSVISYYVQLIYIFIFIAILTGIICAVYIARGVKKAIFELEPEEIAKLLQEKNAILESIREGVVAVNNKKQITMINQAAIKMLNINNVDSILGRTVEDSFYSEIMKEVISTGNPQRDVEINIFGVGLVVNLYPIKHKNKIQGVVASFRKKDELFHLAKELSKVQEYSNMLRSQTHEFSNTLHTIAGLIQIEAYQEALEIISKEAKTHHEFIRILTSTVNNNLLSALIIGKYNYANEMKIEFIIDKESSMHNIPEKINSEKLVLIIGNILDNAFDAVKENTNTKPKVKLFMTDIGNDLIFEIEDSGKGIDENLTNYIFKKGFSSKSEKNRGIGLYLVNNAIKDLKGAITISKSILGGAHFIVIIPKEVK